MSGRLRRRAADERGGTIVFVALCLVVILGSVALVVDVGGGLVMRRRMVNAADAAALAAAESCAKDDVAGAPGQADALANANVAGVDRVSYSTDTCGMSSGSVTVKYHTTTPNFFAQILGFGSSRDVSATATAIWGPAGGGIVIPVEMSARAGQVPCITQPIGSECNYWHDNGSSGVATDNDWGFMNLGEQWNVPPGVPCHDPGATEIRNWIVNGVQVSLNPSGPTYVCITHGFENSTWLGTLAGEKGQIKDFPVNDPSTMIRSPNGKQKYSIIGFSSIRIVDVLSGKDPEALVKCPGHKADANAICLVGEWEGFQTNGLTGAGGTDQGLRAIRLSA